MLCREIITVCSHIQTKTHKNTVGPDRNDVNVNFVVHIVTTEP
jgi:hypothetical protein